jgi:hypothetical protein
MSRKFQARGADDFYALGKDKDDKLVLLFVEKTSLGWRQQEILHGECILNRQYVCNESKEQVNDWIRVDVKELVVRDNVTVHDLGD